MGLGDNTSLRPCSLVRFHVRIEFIWSIYWVKNYFTCLDMKNRIQWLTV